MLPLLAAAMLHARRAMVPGLVGLAALAGMLALAHATQHGIGVAPDSVSYLEAARNLAAGRGVTTTEEDGAELRPLTRFPPLYPAALAAITRLGPDALDAARWLNLVLFGANVVLASLLVARCAPGARWLPVVAAVLMASSPEIAMLHGMALSEPLFLLLAFAGLLFLSHYLETPKGRTLLAASLLIALAFLTRYMGAALVATGILAILLAPKASLHRRVKDAAAFAAIATLPIALWTLRNRLGGAPATGRRFAFHPIDADAIAVAIGTVGEWLLARHIGAALAWLFAAGLLLCTLHWLASGAARAAGAALPRTLALFVLAYLFLLLASICFFDAATPLNGRILSPVLVAILVLALGGVRARVRAGKSSIPVILATSLALIFSFGYARETTQWARERAAVGGTGFASLAWRRSETVRRVAELPASSRIYSNARDAILLLTGRPTRWLPAPVDAETRQPRPNYAAELEAIRTDLRANEVALVWFDRVSWRWYLPSGPDLSQRLPIRREAKLSDGEIWGYDPSWDAPNPR
jgi:Dolichyl-phosphate-mannose-protein mannosyltransferase